MLVIRVILLLLIAQDYVLCVYNGTALVLCLSSSCTSSVEIIAACLLAAYGALAQLYKQLLGSLPIQGNTRDVTLAAPAAYS